MIGMKYLTAIDASLKVTIPHSTLHLNTALMTEIQTRVVSSEILLAETNS